MSKTILLIENDAGFAGELTEALEARGLEVAHSTDGKEGIELAKELGPAAIVLCVELPGMSGYSISNKLKKDEGLRTIPLLLTSAEATPETFEAHRKLKARAEDYLLKPYTPAELISRLEGLVELPDPPTASGDGSLEDLVDEELGDAELSGETQARLRELDLADLPDEPMDGAVVGDEILAEDEALAASQATVDHGEPIEVERAEPEEDADLKLLDDAFDGLASESEADEHTGVTGELAELFQATTEAPRSATPAPRSPEVPGRPDLGQLDDADRELEALRARNEALLAMDALEESGPPARRVPTPAPTPTPALDLGPELAAALSLAPQAGAHRQDQGSVTPPLGMPLLDAAVGGASSAELDRLQAELTERRAALAGAEVELRGLRARVEDAQRRASQSEAALVDRDAELKTLRTRATSLTDQARRDEESLEGTREETRRAAGQARAAEERLAASESRAAAAVERAEAASGRLTLLEESTRGHEAQAAATAEKARGAEALLLAARAGEEKARAGHADLQRALEARAAELEELRLELLSTRGELDGARADAERRAETAKKRVAELEATNAKNEERVVKAYLKIKGDEKLRDKARKALAIASQLLDDGMGAEPAARQPAQPPASTKLD